MAGVALSHRRGSDVVMGVDNILKVLPGFDLRPDFSSPLWKEEVGDRSSASR